MQISKSVLVMAAIGWLAVLSVATPAAGQAPAAQTPASQAPAAEAVPAPSPASSLPSTTSVLQPSLDEVDRMATGLHVERWKRGTVRDEAGSDVEKIVHDIHGTLPALLKTSDAAPDAVSQTLPVVRNIDALYDVLLRVFEASRVVAPSDQVEQIEQSLGGLQKARLALYDRMQDSSAVTEKQVADLRATVKAQAAIKPPPPPPTPVCTPPAPAKRPRKRTTPAKPAGQGSATPAAPSSTPSPSAATKPQN